MELPNINSVQNKVEMVQVLPPWAQEEREIKAIKNDPRLVELLGNAAILDIRKIQGEHGPSYILSTGIGELQVDVHYVQAEPHICGPAHFELFFNEVK
ncbi:MAG: hypothetical protein K1X28_02395 [Parachlamydiales bacterium]|nr:hypothetical protein [Parachlamydiales bacterium]